MLAEACVIWIIIAVAVGVALSSGKSARPTQCPVCRVQNPRMARYCRRCGERLK